MDSSSLQKYQDELMQYYKMQKNKAQENPPEPAVQEESDDELAERYPEPEEFSMPEEEAAVRTDDYEQDESFTEYGRLRIETTSGNRSVPVEDVLVIVTAAGTEAPGRVMALLMTDSSGSTETLDIPSPSRSRSESPSERAVSSFVNITAFKRGYYEVENRNIPVFTGVTSIQPVNMIPLPLNSDNRKVVYSDSQPNL